jgi:hypothetical protein
MSQPTYAFYLPVPGATLVAAPLVLGKSLNPRRVSADTGVMTGQIFVPYMVLWATLMRALLVRARIAPPLCARCGLKLERSSLGETICRCH